MAMNTGKEVYTTILAKVDALIQSFTDAADDAPEIQAAREKAQMQLKTSRDKIEASMKKLEENSEWDVFTIAFYGETNAGKSTLIETLRILLREPAKAVEQVEYQRFYGEYQALVQEWQECEAFIEKIEGEYQDKCADLDIRIGEAEADVQAIQGELSALRPEIEALENTAKTESKTSLGNFFRYLFKKMPAQTEVKRKHGYLVLKKQEATAAADLRTQLLSTKDSLSTELQAKTTAIREKAARLFEKANTVYRQCEQRADGRIIGDGSSDFTRNVTSYEFERDGQKFRLLDLPGIEGNEGTVLDEINRAIRKAHAVFYVTSKSTPPQTGDGREGTLEKIKQHLGEQTEVYSVFNKRVKNPNSLNEPLVDEDEAASLRELDRMMVSHLGEQYRSTLSISAYPAFLGAANCLMDDYRSKQQKFVEHFESKDALLAMSAINTFVEMLSHDVVNDCHAKIKKANYKKIVMLLSAATLTITSIQDDFVKLQKDLAARKKTADKQLSAAAETMKARFTAETESAVDSFKNDVRQKIYAEIEEEIDNDTFKTRLRALSEEGVKELQPVITRKFQGVVAAFQNDVSNIVKCFEKDAAELVGVYAKADAFGNAGFKIDLKLKSGNWIETLMSVAASIGGVILALSNPAGWIVLALGLIGTLISIGKAIIGFLSPQKRAAYQKENASKNIETFGNNIILAITENLAESNSELDKGLGSIKAELEKLVRHVKECVSMLKNAVAEFTKLTEEVEVTGGLK